MNLDSSDLECILDSGGEKNIKYLFNTLRMKYQSDENDEEDVLIIGYYCSCKSSARTLGTCALICSILWYLGFVRHNQNVIYPSTSVIQHIKDAANRPVQDAILQQL
ncbi:unnamed protein product [Phaedon cochleariae]|uniref:Uncharacterized protein n=1 Tax=Phaedon cochleariae TaxID=80249 RepID=A0A9N9SKX4_PHACE|nr:unnamed protein product [Phaedon cochleariae]